jgi:YHS domain-containing protein
MNIRTLLIGAGILLVLHLPGLAQGPGMGRMGGAMDGQQQKDMRTIHGLFDNHTSITRKVEITENGVITTTESSDPKVQAMLAEHVWAMQQRLENRQPIREWDPLFAELFKYAGKIKMEVTRTEKGMKVVETSEDPYVVKLIKAHAAGVSEFAREGMSVMHMQHELPDTSAVAESGFLGKGDGITTCPVTGEPVNKEVKFGFYGRTVYFCCPSCLEAAKKAPERYIRP